MVPIQNCGNKIHWTLINSRTIAVPRVALGGHKEMLWKQNRESVLYQ